MSLTFCLWKDNPTLGYNTWMSQTELCIALCRKGWPPFKSFGNFLERGLSSRLNKEGLSVYLLRAGLCLGNGVHTLQEKCGKLTGFVSFHGGWCKLLQEIKDIVGGGGTCFLAFWDFVGLEKNNGLDFMRYKDWASGNLGYHIEPKKNTGETWSFHCCPSYCCGWEVVLGFSAKSMKPILQQTKTDTQTNK